MTSELDPSQLLVTRLIAHEVPRRKRGDETSEPTLSEAVPNLPASTLNFFGGRLKRTLLNRGHAVESDQRRDGAAVPPLIASYLSGDLDLVEMSQRAAHHLLLSQTGSPHEDSCLFIVCDVSASSVDAVAVMKLEKEEGVHVQPATIEGKSALTVSVLDDLMLTDNTRLFKAGVLWGEGERIVGSVCDTQQGEATDIAEYFLAKFLGCRHQRQPDILTKEFYDVVEKYINKEVSDPEDKLTYHAALQSEIRSNKNVVDPVQFVSDHFSSEHQPALTTMLTEHGIPEAAFPKDSAKLGRRLTRSRLRTAGGIVIAGSSESVRERVRTQKVDGSYAIVINDQLISV